MNDFVAMSQHLAEPQPLRRARGRVLRWQGVKEAMRSRIASVAASPVWARRRWLRLFGWPGLLGAALLAACPAFYVSTIEPARARLKETREIAVSVQEQVKIGANGMHGHGPNRDLTPAEQLSEFYRLFPNDKNMLPLLQKVFDLAETQGIRLNQGEYKMTRDRVGKLARFQMTLPIRGEYPQIRKYLNSLRAAIPIMSMEHLQFERQKVNDSEVDAKIKLALYLEREP